MNSLLEQLADYMAPSIEAVRVAMCIYGAAMRWKSNFDGWSIIDIRGKSVHMRCTGLGRLTVSIGRFEINDYVVLVEKEFVYPTVEELVAYVVSHV